MDQVDVRILRHLGFIPFAFGPRPLSATGPTGIARATGLSIDVVKDRLAKLRAAGVLQGWYLHVNHRHLGVRQSTYHYTVPDGDKAPLLSSLSGMTGICGYTDYVGPEVCVDFYFHDEVELQRLHEQVRRAAKASQAVRFYEPATPPVARPLTATEWRIVHMMRADPKRPPTAVAEALGVSAKTVRRALDRMAAEGSIDVIPLLDPSQVPDIIPFGLGIHLRPGAPADTVRSIQASIDPLWLYCWIPPDPKAGAIEFAAFARSTGDMESLRREVLSIPGVARADVLLPVSMHWNGAYIDAAIQAHQPAALLAR